MGFGDAPNAVPGFEENENEPLVEEQEGLSDLFGKHAQTRVQEIQRDFDTLPVTEDGDSTDLATTPGHPEGLGGLEIGSARNSWDLYRTRYNNKVSNSDVALGQGNEQPRNKQRRFIERDTENDRTKCHKGISGVEESDSREIAEQKAEKFRRAIERLSEEMGLDPSKDPLPQLSDKLKKDKINKTTENRDKIRSVLRESYSEQEIEDIFARFESKETQQDIEMVRVGEWMLRVNEEDPELFGEMMQSEDIDAFIKEHQESAALREFMQDQQRIDELNEEYQKAVTLEHAESALKEAAPEALSAATTVLLAEFGVSADVLGQLPPEGVQAVESVVGRGGGRVLGELLSNGVSLNDEEFTGQVAGQSISLNFAEGDLFLTGENAADRANKSYYRIDPPTPAGFERVLIHSIGQQNRMPYIAQHAEQAGAIWERFVGSPEDEQLPDPANIDRFRNFLVLLIGEGGPDEAEEGRRLQQLGILTVGVESVNRTRVDLFVRALQKYVPGGTVMHEGESHGLGGAESPVFAFEDAVTLARLWDKNRTRFPEDVSELKKLTKIRLEGGDIHGAEHV